MRREDTVFLVKRRGFCSSSRSRQPCLLLQWFFHPNVLHLGLIVEDLHLRWDNLSFVQSLVFPVFCFTASVFLPGFIKWILFFLFPSSHFWLYFCFVVPLCLFLAKPSWAVWHADALHRSQHQIYNKEIDRSKFFRNQGVGTWKLSHSREATKLINILTNPPRILVRHPGSTAPYSLKDTIELLRLFSPLMFVPSSHAHTHKIHCQRHPLPQPSLSPPYPPATTPSCATAHK